MSGAGATERAPAAAKAPAGEQPAAEELGDAFKAAMAAVRRLRGRETHRPGALSNAQYLLLFSLCGGEARSARDLAERAELSAATVAQMLESLEAAGLVARSRSQDDKRVVLTSLTPRGHEVVAQHRAWLEPRWRAALEDFNPDELLTAASVLRRLARYFDEQFQAE